MLMFQQNSACARVGSANTSARSIWLTGGGGSASKWLAVRYSSIDSARIGSGDVCPAGAWPAEIAGQSGQHRHGSQRVAATRLTLEALAQPQERRPVPVSMRCLLDQRCRHARRLLPPTWCARLEQRLELVEAERVRVDELPIKKTVAVQNVGEREGQRRVRARERLQMEVGCSRCRRPDRIDDNHGSRRLGQPVLMLMRRGSRRVRTPDEDAARLDCCLRVEPVAAKPRRDMRAPRNPALLQIVSGSTSVAPSR